MFQYVGEAIFSTMGTISQLWSMLILSSYILLACRNTAVVMMGDFLDIYGVSIWGTDAQYLRFKVLPSYNFACLFLFKA